MKQEIQVGVSGKVFTHGDFIDRNLPESFLSPWNHWLQTGIALSQEQLGSEWLQKYLNAPIWRFALSGNICGEQSAIGVMIPSVDRVGRYFPLTLVALGNFSALTALQVEGVWFQKVEELLLTALQEGFHFENFLKNLNSLPKLTCSLQTPANLSHSTQGKMMVALEGEQPFSSEHCQQTLDLLLRAQYGAYSIWATRGSQVVSPVSLVCEGLPSTYSIPSLYDGNWKEWGWIASRI